MHTGDPAQPVQHSLVTASSGGFFLRGKLSPSDQGQAFSRPRSIGIFGSAGGLGLGLYLPLGLAAAAGGGVAGAALESGVAAG